MEWWIVLLIILGSLMLLMIVGTPVAFCFIFITLIGAFIFWRGEIGLQQLGLHLFISVANFSFMPIPLFILMGEVLFHSGIGPNMIDALDKFLGRLPGRLGLLAVGTGTVLSTLTGSSLSSTAILGSVLVPEMERRGYAKSMSLGPVLGSGGLAIMIPPSALAVFLGAVAEISIRGILMAIIIPGLLMALFYALYIIIRCWLQPSIAAPYKVKPSTLTEKLVAFARHILPTGVIVFLVIGVIFLGVASPTEAAATGALGMFLLAAAYRRLGWNVIKKAFISSMEISGMLFLIMATARAYSQILVFSGASGGLIQFALDLPVAPILIMAGVMAIVLILGMFIPASATIMVVVPLAIPIVLSLGFDPVWFAVLMMLGIEMGATTPPFGAILFVMKGVGPPGTKIEDCYRAALPFLGGDLIVMILLFVFPLIALWLPGITS